MSIEGKLRSFAEAREADDTLIRDGLSYGDARDGVRAFDGLRKMIDDAANKIAALQAERDELAKRERWWRIYLRGKEGLLTAYRLGTQPREKDWEDIQTGQRNLGTDLAPLKKGERP